MVPPPIMDVEDLNTVPNLLLTILGTPNGLVTLAGKKLLLLPGMIIRTVDSVRNRQTGLKLTPFIMHLFLCWDNLW